MDTVRLTAAQAIVRFLVAQRTVVDGQRGAALPRRLRDLRARQRHRASGTRSTRRARSFPSSAGRTSRAWPSRRSRSRRRRAGARSWSPRRRSGPGATNMVTAAGAALANRLPLLLLSGDTFQSRVPDPVLQQVEHVGAPSTTVNDAFRAVTRYWDRIVSPEQVAQSLPLAVETMLDPADCGPAFIGLPQDVQVEAFDYPVRLFEPRVHELRRQRPDRARARRGRRRAPGGPSPAADRGWRCPLLARGGRAPRVRRAPRPAGGRDDGGEGVPHRRPPMLGRAGRRRPAATTRTGSSRRRTSSSRSEPACRTSRPDRGRCSARAPASSR